MKFYSMSFFVDKDTLSHGPRTKLKIIEPIDPWPISLNINSSQPSKDGITIHLKNEFQLIQFVNSVKSSYNKYRKDQGYDK